LLNIAYQQTTMRRWLRHRHRRRSAGLGDACGVGRV